MIEPYKTYPTGELYLGDCLDVMQGIEDKSIDLVVTSPPYNVGIEYDIWNDNLLEKEYWSFIRKMIIEIKMKLKLGGRVCINIPVMGNNPLMKKTNNYLFHIPQYLEIIKSELNLLCNIYKCSAFEILSIWTLSSNSLPSKII